MARPRKKSAGEQQPEQTQAEEPVMGIEGLQDAPQQAPQPKEESRDPKNKADRISLPLAPDGGFDLTGIREGTLEKLRLAALKTPDLFPKSQESVAAMIPDVAVAAMWSMVGRLEGWAASLKFGPGVMPVFEYGPREIGTLMEPTKAVLVKYVGKFGKYQEEIALATVVGAVHVEKMTMLQQALAAHAQEQKAAAERAKNDAAMRSTAPADTMPV